MPFKATLSITETVAYTFAPPCFAYGTLGGAGSVAPWGPVSATSQDCIQPLGEFDANAPAFQFASLSPGVVLDFGQGDQVVATYSGTLRPRAGAPHQIRGHFVITGGTGRFQGASGGGALSGYEDIVASPALGQVTFTGRIVLAAPTAP